VATPPAAAPLDGASGAPPGPPPAAAPTSDDPDRAATRAELRSLRRWLAAAGLWAVAATVIAVLAFLTASDNDAKRIADSSILSPSAQRRLIGEVNRLQARLANVPPRSQVTSVGRQLQQLGRVANRQDVQLVSVGAQLRALRKRVDALERAAGQQSTTTTPTP
jgi:hypothetical protein